MIIGGDTLAYPMVTPTGGKAATASTVRDVSIRMSVAAICAQVRAPSCVLVPYKTAFALRRILTLTLRQPPRNGESANSCLRSCAPCALVQAFAGYARFEQTNPSQLALLQLLWAHHVSSGKDDVRISSVWLDSFIRHDDKVLLKLQARNSLR
jgi:hypothetical protein